MQSEMYIPDDLKLTLAKRFDKRNNLAVLSRSTQTIYPVGGTEYISNTGSNSGVWIEFRLPNPVGSATYDLSTFFIHFNFVIQNGSTALAKTANNLTRVFVHDSIESIFKTVEVYVGSQLIERLEQYGSLETALNAIGVSDNYIKKFGSTCFYAGLSSTQRNQVYTNQTGYAGTTVTFKEINCSVPLRASGVFSPSLQLPPVFGSQYAMVRMELHGPANCIYARQETAIALAPTTGIVSGGAVSALTNDSLMTYKLTQVRATCDVIYYSNEYSQLLNQMLASTRLEFPIKTWDVQSFALASGSTRGTFSLSYAYNSVDSILVWFHRSSELNNFGKAGFDRLVYPPTLNSAQIKVGGKNYPESPIYVGNSTSTQAGASEAYIHLMSSLGNISDAEIIGPVSYTQTPQIVNIVNKATNYINMCIAVPSGGDVFYGRNRNETGTYIGKAEEASSGECFSFIVGAGAVTGDGVNTCTSGLYNPYINEMSPSSFCLGFNLKKLSKESQLGITSGQDIASGGGLVSVQLEFNSATTEAYTIMVAALHNRFLTVQGNNVALDY